ncbi:glycoside hydrolase family 61 protein [Whalleya microplaca]|nr:glycoside hydrolase family 61 protein [Whalleya microplaca]
MGNMRFYSSIAALASAVTVAAHGHVDHIVINGVQYKGYDPTSDPYQATPPTVVGWTASDTDNGFVAPDSYASGDIICHKSASAAKGHAQVAAGDSISVTWNTWPESHKGPMLDYLAACNGACESADKTALEFFKIDGAGYDAATSTWASDAMIANNNTWLVQIPASVKAGNYVLRHETIALHSAGSVGGAQNYPQCFNLEVTGSGTEVPAGTLGTALYKEDDAGIVVNIYNGLSTYAVPGPTLIAGASSSVAQSSSAVTSTGTATAGSGSASAAAVATTTAKASAAAATTAATTTSKAVSTSKAASNIAAVAASTATSSAAPAATSSASAGTSSALPNTFTLDTFIAWLKTQAGSSTKARRHARDVQV